MKRDQYGMFTVRLRPCPTVVVRDLEVSGAAFVWVTGHRPRPQLEWALTELAIVAGSPVRMVNTRSLTCELLLSVTAFQNVADSFDGGSFFFMNRKVPNSLNLESLPEDHRYRILEQNGMLVHFSQPHSHECALISTPTECGINRILAHPMLESLVDKEWIQETAAR